MLVLKGCSLETVELSVHEKFKLESFWCPTNTTLTEKQLKPRETNPLDKITSHKTLSKLNNDPELLKMYFNDLKDPMDGIKTDVCPLDATQIYNNRTVSNGIGKVAVIYDSMARGFSVADEQYIPSTRSYGFRESHTMNMGILGDVEIASQSVSYTVNTKKQDLLEIERDQFNMIKHYPKVMKKLLPILKIPAYLQHMRNLSDALVNAPKLLEQLIFKDAKLIYNAEPPQITNFGGAFKTGTLNPFTGTYECPPYFQAITILTDFNLCISVENDRLWPLRLGGFYNCNSDLKLCPRGYSAYLGTVYNGCEYYYCIRFHARDEITQPIINRPPYTDYRMANAETIPFN